MWNTYTWFSAHNISNFYANWVVNGYPSLGPAMSIYHNTIDVRPDPPGAFNKSAPADGATGIHSTAVISWTSSSGATSYAYCYDTTDNDTCNGSWVNVGNTLSANITLANANTTYYWEVRSIKGNNYAWAGGNDISWRHFTTEPFPGAFNRLTPSNGATNQSASVTLDWANSSNAHSYAYCLWKASDSGCGGWVSTNTASTVTLSNLLPNTEYRWSARAANSFGTTNANGAYWSFTTHASGPTVVSITRSSPAGPPRPSSVTFLVTFSETVSGVSTADFSLTISGLSGVSLTSATGSGATRTVTVNTGTGNGTLRLNVPSNATIADSYGFNITGIPYTNGEVYFLTDQYIFLPLIVR
jgi:hypothetical protein